nr:OmpA family protein [Rhodoblastus sp.]
PQNPPGVQPPAARQPGVVPPVDQNRPRPPRAPGAVPPPGTTQPPAATQPPAGTAQPPATATPPGAAPGRPHGGAPLPPLPGQPPQRPPGAGVPPVQPPPGAPPPAGAAPVPRVPDMPLPAQSPPRAGSGRIGPAGAAALGAAAGAVGGFLLTRPGAAPRSLDAVQRDRREFRDRDALIYQEPGRTIVRDGDRYFLRHDENERFRALGGDLRQERRGDQFVTIYRGRDGDEVVTVTDADGNLVRRYRRTRDGGEVVIIDNSYRGGPRAYVDEVVVLPPPPLRIPADRYIVDAAAVDERTIYDTLTAPPVAPIPRRFTLDEIRSSPDVRAYTRSVDLDTVNFDTGSWTLAPDQVQKLSVLAQALNQAIQRNANEVYLVEGHTDAVGSPVDNLSLSDRRAQSVAEILTRNFGVPPENLTTQGYGAQYPKVQTQGAERRNRRVVVRRITNLLSGQNQ